MHPAAKCALYVGLAAAAMAVFAPAALALYAFSTGGLAAVTAAQFMHVSIGAGAVPIIAGIAVAIDNALSRYTGYRGALLNNLR